VDAPFERGENVLSDNGGMREVDKNIRADGIKRLRNG
jgi:hypothetical protein